MKFNKMLAWILLMAVLARPSKVCADWESVSWQWMDLYSDGNGTQEWWPLGDSPVDGGYVTAAAAYGPGGPQGAEVGASSAHVEYCWVGGGDPGDDNELVAEVAGSLTLGGGATGSCNYGGYEGTFGPVEDVIAVGGSCLEGDTNNVYVSVSATVAQSGGIANVTIGTGVRAASAVELACEHPDAQSSRSLRAAGPSLLMKATNATGAAKNMRPPESDR